MSHARKMTDGITGSQVTASRGMWKPQDSFPMAPAASEVSPAGVESTAGLRPFGLRFLTRPHPSANSDLDLGSMRLDEATQVTVIGEGAGALPVFKHTSGNTSTTTNVNDRKTSDSDTDTEQDK